jgi:hypothetical protein
MTREWWIAAAVVAATVVLLTAALAPLWRRRGRLQLRRLLQRFLWQREQLEARFYDLARKNAPDPHAWDSIEFGSAVSFVRDRSTGRISALMEITLTPSDRTPSDPTASAAGEIHATATFLAVRGRWTTDGRVLYNVSPRQALRLYPDRFEALAQPAPR